MMARMFSIRRFWAVVVKEFIQMRRDRLTFAIMIGIPIVQLILFGYAINSDPRHLPTGVLCGDNSMFARDIVWAMRNSTYFDVVRVVDSRAEADKMLRMGEAQFVLTIPQDFSSAFMKGENPVLLMEADATDPSATSHAMGALEEIISRGVVRDLNGPLAHLRPENLKIDVRVHAQYNPEAITQYNIIPGLMGVILTLTLVIITGLAITRERERGTMENLLSTPVLPVEVMVGKIIPYILVGYVQMCLIVFASRFLFNIPFQGSLTLVFALSVLFIAANLAVGVTCSTVAKNQLQAMQISIFFFLPSLMLSGFMFPFRGMPVWAQCIGEVLPLTHYLRIVRGILLKGDGFMECVHDVWPIALFLVVVIAVGLKRYRRTLD